MPSPFSKQARSVQQAFDLAFVLHPDRYVACCVAERGLDLIPHIRKAEAKRGVKAKAYKMPTPNCALFQSGVYKASVGWELSQETNVHQEKMNKHRPAYTPTADDMLVRYIKLLIWETMNRDVGNVAVGLGTFLYTYSNSQICSLAPDLIGDENIRRDKARLLDQITGRFSHLNTIRDGEKKIIRRPPDNRQKLLVQNALKALAPQVPAHGELALSSLGHFYDYFRGKPNGLSWEGNHLLFCPVCAGFQRFIELFNSEELFNNEFSKRPVVKLDDPSDKLSIPVFEGTAPNANDRFSPPSLTPIEIAAVSTGLSQRIRFRESFSSGQLRVCVDGIEKFRFCSDAGQSGDFSIPLTASYVEIFAGDEEQDLLLAYFELHSLDEVELGQSIELRVKVNRRAKISCAVTPIISDTGDITAASLIVRYEPTLSFFSRIKEVSLQSLQTSLMRLADFFEGQGVAPHTAFMWTYKAVFFLLLSLTALSLRIDVWTPDKIPIEDEDKDRVVIVGVNLNKKQESNPTQNDAKYLLAGLNNRSMQTIEMSHHGITAEQSTQKTRKAEVNSSKSNPQPQTALIIATPSPTPSPTPVPEEKTIAVTQSATEPTQGEMKEAMFRFLRVTGQENGLKGIAAYIHGDRTVPHSKTSIEQVEKMGCKPTDDGVGYLCTYSIKDLPNDDATVKSKRSDKRFPSAVGIRPRKEEDSDGKKEVFTRKFVQDKEGWVVVRDSQAKK